MLIAGPDKKLKLSLNYPASVGRNMDEIVRVVDALQLSAEKSVATPANWPNNHADQVCTVGHTAESDGRVRRGSWDSERPSDGRV